MSQITYANFPGGLIAGQLADLQFCYKRSYKNTTGAVLKPGVLVALGAADDRLKQMTTAVTDKVLGIVLLEAGQTNQGNGQVSSIPFGTTPDTDSYGYADKTVVPVLRKGCVVVAVEAAVAACTDAWVRVTADANPVGGFRSDADAGEAVRLSGARFLTSTSGAGFAVLEIDNPQIDTRSDLVTATVGVEGAASANAIDVVCAVTNPDGSAITVARQVMVRSLPTTADKGDIAAATAAVGTLGPVQNPATGANVANFVTTAAGLFSFKISNDVAEANEVEISGEGIKTRVLRLTFA